MIELPPQAVGAAGLLLAAVWPNSLPFVATTEAALERWRKAPSVSVAQREEPDEAPYRES